MWWIAACAGESATELKNPPGADSAGAEEETAAEEGDSDEAGDSPGETAASDTRPEGGCEVAVPADTRVLETDAEVAEDGASVWVCHGATVSVGGADGALFADERGELVVAGAGSRVWVRAAADVVVVAGPNELWVEDGANVRVEAPDVAVHACPTLTFEAAPGC